MHDTHFCIHHHTIIISGPLFVSPDHARCFPFINCLCSIGSSSEFNSNFIAYNGDLLRSTDANKYSLYNEYINLCVLVMCPFYDDY